MKYRRITKAVNCHLFFFYCRRDGLGIATYSSLTLMKQTRNVISVEKEYNRFKIKK